MITANGFGGSALPMTPTDTTSDNRIDDAKRAMRAACLLRRPDGDASVLRERLARLDLPAVVAGVWPLPGEIDLRPLLTLLSGRGHVVLLPQTTPRGSPLLFRRWTPGADMLAGRFATCHPDGAPGVPQALLVPLLAFDARCHRLGYGGGYYDRTLAALPGARSIGYAWAAQQVAAVPVGPNDRALDAVVTEAGVTEAGVTEAGVSGRACA